MTNVFMESLFLFYLFCESSSTISGRQKESYRVHKQEKTKQKFQWQGQTCS